MLNKQNEQISKEIGGVLSFIASEILSCNNTHISNSLLNKKVRLS